MIGIFDSGFGGLTVLKSILHFLPNYDYIYLGDNARAPYGGRSSEVIYQYSREAVDFLFKNGCDLVILACNTSSVQSLRRLQQEYLPINHKDKKCLGVVRPIAESITMNENLQRVGVIGTRATIESGVYRKEISKLNDRIDIFQNAAPLLVPLIEEGWVGKIETKMILRQYLRPLKKKKVQSLILACTHYPLLLQDIKSAMGKNCEVAHPGDIVARSLSDYLSRHPEFSSSSGKIRKFYTTDSVEKFKQMGEKFLGEKMTSVEKVIL